jgi:hypothetical protein
MERSAHVEWPITGKPNEREKEGTKRTARHEKNPSLPQSQASYLRRKRRGVCIEQESMGCSDTELGYQSTEK